jgi:hypothetical protein
MVRSGERLPSHGRHSGRHLVGCGLGLSLGLLRLSFKDLKLGLFRSATGRASVLGLGPSVPPFRAIVASGRPRLRTLGPLIQELSLPLK